jgi:hypothetical protein
VTVPVSRDKPDLAAIPSRETVVARLQYEQAAYALEVAEHNPLIAAAIKAAPSLPADTLARIRALIPAPDDGGRAT